MDTQSPRFSWIIATSERAKNQTAYQINVATESSFLEAGLPDMWNSNKVMSGKTTHIRYEGKRLASNSTYFWKVRIWDEDGKTCESGVHAFSTGLLSESDWSAKWIGANTAFEPKPEKGFFTDKNEESALADSVYHSGRSIMLRRSFEIPREIASARLFITGLGFYESEINGAPVGDFVLSPAKTPYHKYILYDTYDVTDKLNTGKNVIGIHLGNGWYNPYKKWWKEYRMQWFGYKKALAQLHIKYKDGSEDIVVSDENWKKCKGPVLYNCVYDGEIYDSNKAIPGWSSPEYDDSAWEQAILMDPPEARLVSQFMPAIKLNEVKKPVRLSEPKKGMKVYDLGQNFTGWIRLKMKGERGTKVRIRFSEELYEDGTLNFTCNERAKATVEYIMNGNGLEYYEPDFTYFGFQFVEITSDRKMPEIIDLEGCVIYSANKRIGDFSCSHDLINKMHHATVWSQMSNMLGYPMDCPQRDERLGWMGDAQVTAEEAMFNFDMALHYKNWFSGIRANQDEATGDIPIISPRPYIKDEGVEWSSTFLTMVWNHYIYYGDEQILRENYDAMKRYLVYLGEISSEYIVPPGWIGDWGSMVSGWREGEPHSVSTAYYFYNATIMGKVARVLGVKSDISKYWELASNIRKAYNAKFFNPETGDYNDGSQMANAFPLYLGMVEENFKDRVITNLVHDIEEENNTHLTTGVLGTKYLIDALSMHERSDVSWALATQTTYPSWAEMMKRFNTMCEFWTLKQSHNHVMMGSIDAWFYKVLAGIQLDEDYPAFEKIIIKPYLADELDFVKASTHTIKGLVASGWEKSEEGFKLSVQVPFNCLAAVYIPNAEQKEILEGGKSIDDFVEMEFVEHRNGYSIVNVASGNYIFSY
ncbi:MAG: glycoside hydrolase family 78 protein [Cytophagales bacterium]|nr:glycoside hydrolase family 78 protein [Cytophagales bacterium]